MDISLDCLMPGTQATVTAVACEPGLKARLADFGLICGTTVSCRYESPKKDLKALALRGTVIAVRTTDLRRIRARTV